MAKVIIIPGFVDYPENKMFEKLSVLLDRLGHEVIKIAWPNFPTDLANYKLSNTLELARSVMNEFKNQKAIVLGFSMGGIVASFLAAEFEIDKLGLIVSPYQAGSEDDLAGKYKEWKESGFREITSSKYGKLIIPFSFIEDARKHNALDVISKVVCPKLFVVAEEDDKISLASSEKLFAAALQPKEWFLVKEMKHKYQYQDDKLDEVNNKIIEFCGE